VSFNLRSALRFSVLDRYLLGQLIGPFLVAVFGFALIGLVDLIMYLVDQSISHGVPFFISVRLLIYKLPAIMVLFFPMAVIFSVMLLMIRMAKDNELTILRASGVTLGRVLLPILFFCIMITGLSSLINERVVPWTNRVSAGLIQLNVLKQVPLELTEAVVFKGPGNRYFYLKSVDKVNHMIRGLFIFEEGGEFPRLMTAKTAQWTEKIWTLYDGNIYDIDDDGRLSFFSHFKEAKLDVKQALSAFYEDHRSPKEMNSKELREKIAVLKSGGINIRSLEVELAMKKSIPVACLVFGMIGISFCLCFVKSGKDWWGVIVAICLTVLVVGFYFFLIAVFRALANDGHLLPLVGAWLPTVLYALLGSVTMIYHTFWR
jgi:lipopolysaccharide export system permease protein